MTLNEAFPAWKSGSGIFSYLVDMPWTATIAPSSIDFDYHGNHSGSKEVSALIDNLIENGVLSEDNKMHIARVIELRYKLPWEKLYETMSIEYDILKPYSMKVSETKNSSDKDKQGISESSDNESKYKDSSESKENVFGFDSPSEVPANSNKGNESGDSSSNVNKKSSMSAVKSHNEKNEIIRSGNYGFFTAQKLITDDRNMWLWQFFSQVYSDIDTILTCPLY